MTRFRVCQPMFMMFSALHGHLCTSYKADFEERLHLVDVYDYSYKPRRTSESFLNTTSYSTVVFSPVWIVRLPRGGVRAARECDLEALEPSSHCGAIPVELCLCCELVTHCFLF